MAQSEITPSVSSNLLRLLPAKDFALIEPHLEPIELNRRLVLQRPQSPIEQIHFPDSGIAAIVTDAGRGRRVEGLLGRDGHVRRCRRDGRRPLVRRMLHAMDAWPGLRLLLLRYVQSPLVQTAHTALANAQAQIEERLCRWLLMCRDRHGGDELPLTHELLATMLGVRRAGVTTAIHMVEARALIRATRSWAEILDREGLDVFAVGIYGTPEADLDGSHEAKSPATDRFDIARGRAFITGCAARSMHGRRQRSLRDEPTVPDALDEIAS